MNHLKKDLHYIVWTSLDTVAYASSVCKGEGNILAQLVTSFWPPTALKRPPHASTPQRFFLGDAIIGSIGRSDSVRLRT